MFLLKAAGLFVMIGAGLSTASAAGTITLSGGGPDVSALLRIPLPDGMPAAEPGQVLILTDERGNTIPAQVARADVRGNEHELVLLRPVGMGRRLRIGGPGQPDTGARYQASKHEAEAALVLALADSPIVRYQSGIRELPDHPDYATTAFFHPLYTPAGIVVTDDAPADHLHHRGVFLTFVKVTWSDGDRQLEGNFWHDLGKDARIAAGHLHYLDAGPVCAVMAASHDFLIDEQVVLTQEVSARAARINPRVNVLDLDIRVIARHGRVELGRNFFNGLQLRGAAAFERAEQIFTYADGKDHPDVNERKQDPPYDRWFDQTAPVEEGFVGTTLAVHPDTPPGRLCYARRVKGLNANFLYDGPMHLDKDQAVRFRYQFYIHDGTVAEAGIPALAEWYNPGFKIEWQSLPAPAARPGPEAPGQAVSIPAGQAQLFLDDHFISESRNITRQWHPLQKHPDNPLVDPAPWERHQLIFGSVIREPDPVRGGEPIFRMWYYTIVDDEPKMRHRHGATGVGYAVSRDGLNWEKPALGLYEFNGNLDNNVTYYPSTWDADGNPVDKTRFIELAGVIRDPRPDVPDDERYKMIVGTCNYECSNRECGTIGSQCRRYISLVSPDGIHWREVQRFVFPYPPHSVDRACLVWDPYQELYAFYHRSYGSSPEMRERALERDLPVYDDGYARAISYATSRDFREWTLRDPPVIVQVDETEPDCTHIYQMSAWPTGGQWVALWQHHNSWTHKGTIEIGIAHSRDGIDWHRIPWTEFLVLTNGGIGQWDRFNQAVATAPVRVGDELWMYYSGRLERHSEARRNPEVKDKGPRVWEIGLATIRLDGWCSLQAGFERGEVVTVPVVLPEGQLYLNAKSDWGEIVVEVLDRQGEVIDNMISEPVRADGVRVPVSWSAGKNLADLAGQEIQLRFRLSNALLYSWKIDE